MNAIAQNEFFGTWILQSRKSLFGPEYVNGLPVKIKIIKESDSFRIERVFINQDNNETNLSEVISINSSSSDLNSLKERRVTQIEWAPDQKSFSEIISSYSFEKPEPSRVSIWKFSIESDGRIKILRSITTPKENDNWSMEGLYEMDRVGEGVKFEHGLTWENIKSKAKRENKYIFVDCFASWCEPCKRMDMLVYPLKFIGDAINDKFISVKVQLDSSTKDNAETKLWYKDAHAIQETFKVTTFPTFLFFSPGGEVLHRDQGFKRKDVFVSLLDDATDSTKQYYTLLKKYEKGHLDETRIPALVNMARNFDENIAIKIAKNYVENYLFKFGQQKVNTKETIEFISSFPELLTNNSMAFNLFHSRSEFVDSIMAKKGYSLEKINYAIKKVEIEPKLDEAKTKNEEPDWKKIQKIVEKKYGGVYSLLSIRSSQAEWYKDKKDWSNYTKYLVSQVELTGVDNIDAYLLNNFAWDVFLYSKKKSEIGKAISWSDRSIIALKDEDPLKTNHMDTKANLLYKAGRVNEAISLEEDVLKRLPKFRDAANALQKMKLNEPTWPLVPNPNN